MGKPAWTPGPWSAEVSIMEHNGDPFVTVTSDAGDIDYLTLRPSDVVANARLIAAAPDLFEALDELIAGWDLGDDLDSNEYWDRARAAIEKALGSPSQDATSVLASPPSPENSLP